MTEVVARFARLGNRIGFLSRVDDDGRTQTFAVLPKVWRGGPATVGRFALDGSAVWVLHEGDELIADRGSASGEFLLDLGSDVPTDVVEVTLRSSPAKRTGGESPLSPSEALGALLGLFLHSIDDVHDVDIAYGDRGDLTDALHRATLVTEAERSVDRIRPRYQPVVERSRVWRGAVDATDLARSRFEGRSAIAFRHDVLTADLPEWRLVATALEAVARTRAGGRVPVDDSRVRARAMRMRRALNDLATLPRSSVRASMNHLTNLQRNTRFARLAAATEAVLRQQLDTFDAASDSVVTRGVIVRTEALWESLLGEAAIAHWGASRVFLNTPSSLAPGVDALPPWQGTPGRDHSYPDILVDAENRIFCVDAKYKVSLDRSVSRQDQYQIFTYSHVVGLAGRHGAPMDVVLAFPGVSADVANRSFERSGLNPFQARLTLLPLPFPTPAEANDGLNDYLPRVSEAFALGIGALDTST